MHIHSLRHLVLLLTMIGVCSGTEAQFRVRSFFDIGRNHASEGVFLRNSCGLDYKAGKYSIAGLTQFDLKRNAGNIWTGLSITGSRDFKAGNVPFRARGYYVWSRFSELLYETDWGVTASADRLQHFLFELGTNFKTYAVNAAARKEFGIDKTGSRLHENFSLVYLVTAFLKPHDHRWNIGVSCTNMDHFIINQSTNPVFNLKMRYDLKPGLTLFMESWYKSAGIFNISVNYFGYFFRTGIRWELIKPGS
jgi:hypothetical protein